jgi:hypothetical protein
LVALILGRGVEVSSAGTGDEFDFITHDSVLLELDFFAAGAHIGKHRIDPFLIDNAHTFRG